MADKAKPATGPSRAAAMKANLVSSKEPTFEELLRAETVGYVKHEDFIATRERIEREQEEARLEEIRKKERAKQEEKAKKAIAKSKLSFSLDGDEDDGADDGDDEPASVAQVVGSPPPAAKKAKLLKNPDVDTSFLPDRDKQLMEQQQRDALQREWTATQDKLKQEDLEVTYSYYDGKSHRRTLTVKKGNTIGEFLAMAMDELARDFPKLYTSSGGLMYIKEDIIMPTHMTFYDFIVSKARGKSGPLFSFDTYDDVRLETDSTKETVNSHTGKVVTRHWYESKKTTFPVCRWEPYDPDKVWEKYTIKS
eukprot:TRINITY_DN5100_c0_g1_i1.p1 TRINITY_DN5100_c0_g1~~TRINITY_DN5100_c0_g1_i1.p1  ORF type:complete len:308 (-),score=132.14 TRINITY_DN5100_c0_g1_i1:112-1035(-)